MVAKVGGNYELVGATSWGRGCAWHSLPGIYADIRRTQKPLSNVQGSGKRRVPGLVDFIPAVAHLFCLALPAEFSQPGTRLLAEPSGSVLNELHCLYRCVLVGAAGRQQRGVS